MQNRKVSVLVVDDSAVVREALREILATDSRLELMGTANDPLMAADRMQARTPDVILLDIEMPRMDGITFLEQLMAQHPIPVVICSSLAEQGAEPTLRALELGAVDIITKPRLGCKQFLLESSQLICDAVYAASQARCGVRVRRVVEPKLTADAVLAKPTSPILRTTERVVMIGASTGGTEALRVVLESLPGDCPGIVVVQHMPENFTRSFAARLDSLCQITVKEARDDDTVLRGQALIAPGNRHTLLKRSGARYYVEVKEGPLVSRHRPSVDVLFRSAARYAGPNAYGILMTGMGDDGARGLLEMREAGAITAAQDEATCVVYGMPAVAKRMGAAAKELPLGAIASSIIGFDTSSERVHPGRPQPEQSAWVLEPAHRRTVEGG